jgi:hypothetical protein
MARRPFFSGNYGSALGSTANAANLIARAGATQGQMMANMGAQIGGMIQQYGLNKEKQKKADARIKSALNSMGEFVEAGALSPENKTKAEEFLNDPNRSSTEKVAFIEEQEKRMFQLPKLQLAQAQAKEASNQAIIGDLTKDNEIAISGLKVSAQRLMNRGLELNNLITTAKSEAERDKLRQEKEINDANIAQLKEQTRGLKGKNDIFDLTKEELVEQNKLKTKMLLQETLLNTAQIEKLNEEIKLLGANQADEKKKLQAQIANLEADTQNKLAEASLFKSQADEMNDLIKGPKSTDSSLFRLDSIEEGAQGDITGLFKSSVNAIGDFLNMGTPFDRSRDAKAQVKSLKNALLPAFIEGYSERGSEWAKKTAEEIIPNENMTDGEFRATLRELPNKLEEKMRVDRSALRKKLGTESQKLRMARNLEEFPVLIQDLNRIINQDSASSVNDFTDEQILERYR